MSLNVTSRMCVMSKIHPSIFLCTLMTIVLKNEMFFIDRPLNLNVKLSKNHLCDCMFHMFLLIKKKVRFRLSTFILCPAENYD